MKRLITYLLLYAYALVLIKPVIPILADVVAHTFYKLEHLQVVHQHDGVYHVDKAIEEENKQSDASGKTVVSGFADTAPHELITYVFSPVLFSIQVIHRSSSLQVFPVRHASPLYQPPKASV